jgi:hypothetical protein
MPNQGCEEARKFLDACETEAMLRAQKEGLSPGTMQALYRLGMPSDPPSNPIQDHAICLDRFGYSHVRRGRPQLCPGTYCFEENAQYYQFWNEANDGMFLLKHTVRPESQVVATAPMPIVLFANINHLNSYFVGSEDELKRLGIQHEVMTCPLNKEPCNQPFKTYVVTGIIDAFLASVGEKDVQRYMDIIKEEIAKMDKQSDTHLGKRL